METRAELEERRAYECRLTPDRALETIDDAEVFLRERGLVTRTPDSALPSLHEACHERPYAPGGHGFGSWPATKWWWSFELVRRPGLHALKLHRGKSLFATDETAALADPVCRAELERMEREDPAWARLLRHLDDAGPSTTADLRLELGLKAKELKDLRAPLERCGAVVAHRVEIADDGYTTELVRWDHLFPEPAPGGGLPELLVAGVRSAVVAPEGELPRWFSWTWLWQDELVDELVAAGRLYRPERGWVAAAW